MATQITLIGLGRRGGSIGLALRNRASDLVIVGHDRDPGLGRAAQSKGVVDRLEWNLPRACESADLAVLAMPLSGVQETLAVAGDTFRADCVVTTLAPLLAPPLAWAAQSLPPNVHFIAGNFAANPATLGDGTTGLDGARADLFKTGLWAIAPAPACPAAAVKLVTDLAAVLGATPIYIDPAEHDGLSAGTEAMPALAAVAIMRAVTRMQGWSERRKLTNREFAALTAAAEDDPAGRRAAVDLNRENVLRQLDAVIEELGQLRAGIAAADWAQLESLLAEAREARLRWMGERSQGNWQVIEAPPPEMPKPGDFLGNLLGFRRRSDKVTGGDKDKDKDKGKGK
jgi:prephenate dehydrogenase